MTVMVDAVCILDERVFNRLAFVFPSDAHSGLHRACGPTIGLALRHLHVSLRR
jgi:hypothetical protein